MRRNVTGTIVGVGILVALFFFVTGGEARSNKASDGKQAGFTVELTKKDGTKMTVTDFRIDDRPGRQKLSLGMFSHNVSLEVPLSIVSSITDNNGKVALLLGDGTTIEGTCSASFIFKSDLGKEGAACADIKAAVFKKRAAEHYAEPPAGKHSATIFLKGGKRVELAGASFLASKFDKSPKYRYPQYIGDEYPASVHFEGEESGTFYDISWTQIGSIVPLAERHGNADCRILMRSGREITAWANYWWTADRIRGVVPIGNYRLFLTLRYSAAPSSDYEKVELR